MLNAHEMGRKYEASPGGCGESNGFTAETRSVPRKAKPQGHGGAHGERCLLLAASGLLARGFFLWCFCYDQVVGLANEGFKFIEGEDVGVCQEDPFVTTDEIFRIYEANPREFAVSWESMLAQCTPESLQRFQDACAQSEAAGGQFNLELEI